MMSPFSVLFALESMQRAHRSLTESDYYIITLWCCLWNLHEVPN